MRDQHGLRLFIHQQDAHHFAVALGGFDVDDAFAAARLLAVFVDQGALAVAVFGDAEDLVGEGGGDLALRDQSPLGAALLRAPLSG